MKVKIRIQIQELMASMVDADPKMTLKTANDYIYRTFKVNDNDLVELYVEMDA